MKNSMFDEALSKAAPEDVVSTTFSKFRAANLKAFLSMALIMIVAYMMTWGLQWLADTYKGRLDWVQTIASALWFSGHMTNQFWQGQLWRPVTHMFLHGNNAHLFSNLFGFGLMFFLASDLFSRRGWLWIFFISGYLGAVATLIVDPNIGLVGASGGIMGLFGATIAGKLRSFRLAVDERPAYQLVPLRVLLVLLACQFIFEFAEPSSNISHSGHLFGLLFGFLLGALVPLNAGEFVWASRPGVTLSAEATAADSRLFITHMVRSRAHQRIVTVLLGGFDQAKDFVVVERREFDWRFQSRSVYELVAGTMPDEIDSASRVEIASHYAVEGVKLERRRIMEELVLPPGPPLPLPIRLVLWLIAATAGLLQLKLLATLSLMYGMAVPASVSSLFNLLTGFSTALMLYWVARAFVRPFCNSRKEKTPANTPA